MGPEVIKTDDQKKNGAPGPSPSARATITVLRNWNPAPIIRTEEGRRVRIAPESINRN